jgi:hypothetical protein
MTSKIPLDLLQPTYDHTTPKAVLDKLKHYEQVNQAKKQQKYSYKYNPIQLPSGVDKFVDPTAYVKPSTTDHQQIGELLRMAKMTARVARLNKNDDGYDAEKSKFMSTYSSQISKYNLYTKMHEIWNNFADRNYSEPAYDKDYLGSSASNDYLKSLTDRMTAEKTLEKTKDGKTKAYADIEIPTQPLFTGPLPLTEKELDTLKATMEKEYLAYVDKLKVTKTHIEKTYEAVKRSVGSTARHAEDKKGLITEANVMAEEKARMRLIEVERLKTQVINEINRVEALDFIGPIDAFKVVVQHELEVEAKEDEHIARLTEELRKVKHELKAEYDLLGKDVPNDFRALERTDAAMKELDDTMQEYDRRRRKWYADHSGTSKDTKAINDALIGLQVMDKSLKQYYEKYVESIEKIGGASLEELARNAPSVPLSVITSAETMVGGAGTGAGAEAGAGTGAGAAAGVVGGVPHGSEVLRGEPTGTPMKSPIHRIFSGYEHADLLRSAVLSPRVVAYELRTRPVYTDANLDELFPKPFINNLSVNEKALLKRVGHFTNADPKYADLSEENKRRMERINVKLEKYAVLKTPKKTGK